MYGLVIRSSVRVHKQSQGGVARWEKGHAVHILKPSVFATVDEEGGSANGHQRFEKTKLHLISRTHVGPFSSHKVVREENYGEGE